MINEILEKIGFDWHLALVHTINFLIIFVILVKFALPKLKKTIEDRKAEIEKGLENTRNSNKILEESEKVKDSAVKEASDIKKSMLLNAEELKFKTIKEGESEKENIISNAKREAEKLKNQGFDEGAGLLLANIDSIFSKISESAFAGKVTPEVNKDFVKKVLENTYAQK